MKCLHHRRGLLMTVALAIAAACPVAHPRALGQAAPRPNPFAAIDFLLGDWDALAKPGEGAGYFSLKPEAQGQILVRHNHAESPAANGRPAGTHDDLMVIYRDGREGEPPRLRADYFDNEGHIIHYTIQAGADGTVTFLGEILANAPRYRLSYARLPNGNVRGRFEIAPPGAPEAFTSYLTWEAKRRNSKAK